MRSDHRVVTDPRLLDLVPDARRFYAGRPAGRGPAGYDALLDVRATRAAPATAEPPALVRPLVAGGRQVRGRIHLPRSGQVAGALLSFPGGGFYLSSAAAADRRNRRLADALGIAVISVDYRLAPECPWPAAPDDAETAARWLAEHADGEFGTTNLAVEGFSAGATLAVTTLLRAREWGRGLFDCAVLQFGTYDLSGRTSAGRLIADEYFLQAYVGHVEDRTDPDISPVYADPSGLPPVLIVVGAEDVLLEDNLAMAARLSAARVEVDLRVYPAVPHGFTGHPTAMAAGSMADITTWLSRRSGSDAERVVDLRDPARRRAGLEWVQPQGNGAGSMRAATSSSTRAAGAGACAPLETGAGRGWRGTIDPFDPPRPG